MPIVQTYCRPVAAREHVVRCTAVANMLKTRCAAASTGLFNGHGLPTALSPIIAW